MLRAFMLAAIVFAAVPSVGVLAEPSGTDAPVAKTTETQSGTTTFFGDASKAAAPEAAKQPAPVAAKPQPLLPPTLTASVDLSRQTMTVSVNGEPRYTWAISSGTAQFPTPTGNFRPEWTSKMWYSRKYDNAPMPHAVFINGGVAVHGTSHVRSLGAPASHGCIRLAPGNAKTFYNLVQRHGLQLTRVSVHGRPNWRDGAIASRRDRDSRREVDVANSNQGGWFWGNSWGSADSSYDAPPVKKKDHKGYAYVYIDGVPTKVYRQKNGQYVYKAPSKQKKYYNTYGSAY